MVAWLVLVGSLTGVAAGQEPVAPAPEDPSSAVVPTTPAVQDPQAPRTPAVAEPAVPANEEPAAPRPTFQILRATGPIVVDGNLDEAIYQQPPTFELLYETYPSENTPAPVRTEVWVTYDDNQFYAAFRAHDTDPQLIRARLTDRDKAFQDDFVGVVLDTFNDERRGFEFFVNPLGVQMDLFQNEITGNENDAWDAIWSSAGRITEQGYVVELAVPFSSLRFTRVDGPQTWGIDALRIRPREHRARLGLNPQRRGSNCYLCQSSKLTGIEGISPGRNLEFDPTVTAGRTDRRNDFPNGALEAGDENAELGLTARWGVTPNLTLNAAINPDFSQVEADVAQLDVNTQFTLFFPEKRPFFLEGADFFDTRIQAFHSRNIADPKWGLKLSGKEGKNGLGLILAQDRITNLVIPGSERSRSVSVDEENVSTVLRYRRDVAGASTVGFLYTGREGDNYFNRVAGADALFRWDETEAARIEILGSQTEYPTAVTSRVAGQEGTLEGHALRAVYQHSGREWYGYVLYQDVGEDFRADLGFIPQVDLRRGDAMYEHYWYPEKNGWTRFALGTQLTEDANHEGDRLARIGKFFVWANGPRESYMQFNVFRGDRSFNGRRFDENYLSFFGEARLSKSFYFYTEARVGDGVDFANTRQGDLVRLDPGVRFDLGKHLRLTVDHSYAELDIDAGRLFTANLTQLRTTYQFNVRTFVRLVTQYQQFDPVAERYLEPGVESSKDLFNQLLFSYKLNPQTVLFLGYSDFALGGEDLQLTKESRTLFFKIGYALVM